MKSRPILLVTGSTAVLMAVFLFFERDKAKSGHQNANRENVRTSVSPRAAMGGPSRVEEPGIVSNGGSQAVPADQIVPTAPAADPIQKFQDWTRDYLTASPGEKSRLEPAGIKLAEERRPAFKSLIMESPREAIRRAVPMVVRQKLPASIVSRLEKRINEIGALRVFQGIPLNPNDPPVPTRREVELKNGATYRAYVYGERANKVTWTPGAFVNGVALDSEFAISDEPTRRLEVGEILPAGKPVVGNCPVSGKFVLAPEEVPEEVPETLAAVETPVEIITFCDGSHIAVQNQTILYGEGVTGGSFAFSGILPGSPTPALGQVKVIVIPTTYADQNTVPSTEAALYAALRDVADHYSKASYGRLSLSGVVTPPVKLPHNEAWYVNRDTSNGGDIGGTSISMADARAEAKKLGYDWTDYDCTVMRHNGGPGSYGGLGGGNTVWVRGDQPYLWAHEIGHAFGLAHSNFWDTAGTSSIGNGANQEYGDSYDIMGGGNVPAGHYNAQAKNQIRWLPSSFIQPVTQSGLYRIYPYDQNVLDSSKRYAMTILKDNQRTYWGMVRSLYDSNPFAKNGLVLGWRYPNGGGGNFQLIDTTNGSPFAKDDAPVSLGATFSDTESGIHITTVAANDSPRYIDVQVNMGAFPANQKPMMTLAASAEVIPLNGTVTFTATASDPDGDPLAFNWQHFGSSSTKIVSPNSNVITRQFTTAGTYVVTCTVSDMKGGTVTRNNLITVGSSSTFTISGRVTLLGQGLQDVVVTANNANGVITDADGYFTIPNLAANTYTLTPMLYGYSFGELFNNSITVGPGFSGANFEATAQSVVTISTPAPNANEAAPVTPGTFRLTRSGDNSQDLVVNVNPAFGGATITTDYTLSPAYAAGSQGFSTFTIPAGSSTLDVTVTPVADTSGEGPETVVLQLGPGNGYLVGSDSSATVVILDDDTALPKVALSATTPATTENSASPAVFTVSRTGSTSSALTVNYTVSGSATPGGDYTALAGSVTIPAGSASATVQVDSLNDSISENLESVILTLATNAAYIIDPLATGGTASIYDDDLQTVSVTASDNVATEVDLSAPGAAADTGTFLITRSGDTTNALTVYYAFSGTNGSGVMALHGVDFEWMPGVAVIPAGQTSASITILPRYDSLSEGPEQCVLNLGANATNYQLGTSSSATVTINDNPSDKPYIDVVNTAVGVEPSTNANFRFTVRGDTSAAPVAVNFTLSGTAVNGTDYDTIGWWVRQSSGSTENLRAVWAANATNLWAVGDNGTILKGDGTTWSPQSSGTTQHLRAVWGTSATSVWAVGDGGTILFYDGSTWTAQTSGTTNSLRGIWGSEGTNIFAVGDGGTIVRSTNGTSWTATTSGTTNALRAVHGADANNIWTVGAGGTILKWNGTTWAAQTSGVTAQLNSVFAVNSTNIWAVGNAGVVRKGTGTSWSAQTSANSSDLNAVWASSTTSLLAAGALSTQMVSTTGTSWSNATVGSACTFNSVSGTSSTIGWAVGDGGAVFKRDNANAAPYPGGVVIPRGSTTYDLAIRTKDDTELEDLETITLTINPDPAYQTFAPTTSATASLRDNDNVNTLVLDTQVGTGGAVSIAEGATTSPVKFYISRIGATTAALTVNLTYSGTATGGGVDYTAPASVTIPAGAKGVDVPVTITNDTIFEGTETIILSLGAGGYSRGVSATMYLTDNDTATATVSFNAPSSSGLESVTNVSVPVILSAAQASDVTVEYQTSGSTSGSNTSNTSSPIPYWVRVVKSGSNVSYFQSNDGQIWTQRGSTVSITGLGNTSYLAGIAFAPGSTTQYTTTIDNFSVSGMSAGGALGAETAANIGTVTGSGSSASGVYTFTNSGNGLTNATTDSFRYVYLPVSNSADCTVTARITSVGNGTSTSSRAGVMLRATTANNAIHASSLATGVSNGSFYSLHRTTAGGTSTLSSAYTSHILPMWVRTVRAGATFTQSLSRDGASWTALSASPAISYGQKLLAGLAVSAASDGQIATATFDNVSLNGSPVTNLGGRTIGFVNEQGSESYSGGTWTVNGSGAGIGGTNDEAHFPSTEVSGDFTLVARVSSLSGGATGAQAGIMVRDDTNYYARNVYAGWVKSGSIEQRYRLQSNTTAFGSGVDYIMPPGVLTIPAGQTTGNINFTVVNDTMDEPDNLVTIQLQNARGANIGANAYHGYTIIDDDNPPSVPYAGFALASSTVAESAGTAQIAVSLSSAATAACSVDYSTANGSAANPGDYTSTSGTLAFVPGETVKYISVPITDDTTMESAENLSVTLSNPVGLVLGAGSTHTLGITDDDAPVVTIVANDANASESGDAGQFTLSRTGNTTNPLAVTLTRGGTATSGTDYAAIGTALTIPAGQSSLLVNVTPIQDTSNEGGETVILTVASASGYVVGAPASATVTLADDDRSTVTLVANDAAAAETPGNNGQFTITRTAPTNVALTVNLTIAGTATNTTDYATVAGTVSFASGDVSKTITISPVDDGTTEGPESVTLSLNTGSYDIGAQYFDNVTISDNDNPPAVFINSPSAQGPLVAASNGIIVSAQVSDDGAPAAVTQTWSCVSGPGTATIESPNSTTTAVTFSAPGTYVLRITATDTQFTVSDQVTVFVGSAAVASNWITQDLTPSSARRGQGLEYGGLFTVTGTGAGYASQTNDGAHIMVRPATGDGSVTARLTGFSTTGALAGITIRDSLARGSTRAVLGYVPGTGLQFRTRTTVATADTSVAAAAPSLPCWLKLTRNSTTNEVTASYAPDAGGAPGAWTQIGTPVAVPLLNADAHYGLTVTNNSTAASATAVFDNVSLTPAPTGPALVNEDSGTAPNTSGSASFDGTTYTVNGPTTGYFYGWQYDGDLDISCRMPTFTSGAGSASGGIRIAESIENGAYLHLGRMPTSSYSGFYWTSIAGGSGGGVPSGISAGNWMRIVRRGNSITAYRATHNSTTGGPNPWTQIGQAQTIIMTTPVWVGFYVNNASGASGTQNTCTFTNLTITPVNKAPVIAATASGNVSLVTLDGTITDDSLPAEFTSLWSLRGGPSGVTITNPASVDTTATMTQSGTYGFRLAADDTAIKSFFDLSYTTANQPPVWTSNPFGGANATEDSPYADTLVGKASDADPGTILTYAKVSGPAWLDVASDGALSGTPDNSDVGTNTFTVSVSDGVAPSVQATMTITVVNTNDAPVFVVNPLNTGDAVEDSPYDATISGSATDVDNGATLTYSKSGGPAWLNVSANGTLSGTPGNNDVGANSFTISVSDGIAPAVQAVLNLTVVNTNDIPVWANNPITGANATEDAPYAETLSGLASDIDGGATLAFAKISGPAWLTISSVGTISGTPANSDVGMNSFTVSVSDGIAPPVQTTLNISVINTNDAPAWAGNPFNGPDATEDTAYVGTLAGSASDIDQGAALSFSKKSGPAWLSVASNGALSGTPANSDVGANSFTVSVSDGIAAPVEATFNLTVINANDAPVWTSNPVNGTDATEDSAYSASLAGSATDVDAGAVLTFVKVSGPAWLGVAADGTLTGTPANSDVGTNSFTVSVSDGIAAPVEATFNLVVINTNDAPVWTVNPVSGTDATEDSAYSASLAGSVTDVDAGGALTFAKVSGPAWLGVAADGTLTGTPANSDVGTNSFTVSVSDGIVAPVEATFNLTVINTNDAPVWTVNPFNAPNATEISPYSATLVGNAGDVDAGAALTFAKVSGPVWLVVTAEGILSGTPGSSDFGNNSFIVSVSDGIAPPVELTLNIQVTSAAYVVYEPFADSNSTLTGNTPGAGLTGTWLGSGAVAAGSLNYGNLPTGTGSKASVNNQNGYVAIGSALGNAGLLNDGASLWFSVLVQTGNDIATNGDLGFAFGTDQIGSGNNIPVANNGQALGFTFKNNLLRASYWSPGALTRSSTNTSGNGAAPNTLYLVVGKFTWGATTDKLEIFKPAADLTLGAAVSTYTTTGNLNQALFDTISFGSKTASPAHLFDEIRFGPTYNSVTHNNGGNNMILLDDLQTWLMSYGEADLSDLGADFDADGLSNGDERVWGLDPTNAASFSPIAIPLDPATGMFRYTRRDPSLTGLRYTIWYSADMLQWSEDTGALQTPDAPDSNKIERVDVAISPTLLSEKKLFIRVQASD